MTRRRIPLIVLLIAACLLLGPVGLETACAGECVHVETAVGSRRPDVGMGLRAQASPAAQLRVPLEGRSLRCPVALSAVGSELPASPQRAGGLPLLI